MVTGTIELIAAIVSLFSAVLGCLVFFQGKKGRGENYDTKPTQTIQINAPATNVNQSFSPTNVMVNDNRVYNPHIHLKDSMSVPSRSTSQTDGNLIALILLVLLILVGVVWSFRYIPIILLVVIAMQTLITVLVWMGLFKYSLGQNPASRVYSTLAPFMALVGYKTMLLYPPAALLGNQVIATENCSDIWNLIFTQPAMTSFSTALLLSLVTCAMFFFSQMCIVVLNLFYSRKPKPKLLVTGSKFMYFAIIPQILAILYTRIYF